MNSLKLIIISCSIILLLILLLLITHLLTKNFKSKINNDGKLKISFGIWYSAIFLSGANVISIVINTLSEVVDNLIKIRPVNLYLELIKITSLVIGVGFTWLILWFIVIKFLTKITHLKMDENEEMDDDNFSYFIIKGIMLFAIIFSLSSILSLILRLFIPNIETPFYH
ncbi:hypothetical protein [Pedobacter sp. Hv1]|uniref:hypothetical protein n=1 Tax=Pedobacter sp. Hv1 TaxID=1740090 RepID=UPI0006D892E5|nr:hypothetical protein [Pedobacter sp. Hv1]KQB99955.1 hypothetical protein AQF98_15725 [Pedobacter sp. Hv1]